MKNCISLKRYYNKDRILNGYNLAVKKVAYNSVCKKASVCFESIQKINIKKLKFLETCNKIEAILNELPYIERQIFDNVVGMNKTYKEIAEETGVALRTVYRRMSSAKNKVANKIRGIENEEYNSK